MTKDRNVMVAYACGVMGRSVRDGLDVSFVTVVDDLSMVEKMVEEVRKPERFDFPTDNIRIFINRVEMYKDDFDDIVGAEQMSHLYILLGESVNGKLIIPNRMLTDLFNNSDAHVRHYIMTLFSDATDSGDPELVKLVGQIIRSRFDVEPDVALALSEISQRVTNPPDADDNTGIVQPREEEEVDDDNCSAEAYDPDSKWRKLLT